MTTSQPVEVVARTIPEDVQLAVDAAQGAVNAAQVQVLKNTICSKLSIPQIQLYLTICARKGIDPFTQAFAFPQENGGLAFGLRIDGMRALASRTGELLSRKVETIMEGTPPKLAGARATIERKGMTAPVVEEAWMAEYDKAATPGGMIWRSNPETMIRKVAESKALRAAFADALSGLYEPSELAEERGA